MTGTEGFPKASHMREQVAEQRQERRQQYLRTLRSDIMQALKQAPQRQINSVVVKVPDVNEDLTSIVVAELEKQGYTVEVMPEVGGPLGKPIRMPEQGTYSDMVISFAAPQAK